MDRGKGRATLGALALVCACLAWPSAAGAQAPTSPVLVGPDLSSVTPTNAVTCAQDPFLGEAINASSCTWATGGAGLGATASPQTNFLIQDTGTISQVMIKVGATTGPMQVVLLQLEENLSNPLDPKVSCCTEVGQSATFTPAGNATTTEPVDLPISGLTQSGTLQTADFLGLSVLEDGVPVPAVNETAEPIDDQASLYAYAPAIQANQTLLADAGVGYLVTMDGLWNPPAATTAPSGTTTTPTTGTTPTPSGTGAPAPTGGPTPTVTQMHAPNPLTPTSPMTPILSFPAVAHLATVSGHNAVVRLACGGAPCAGTVRIQNEAPAGTAAARAATAGAAAKQKPKRSALITYASGSFSLGAGQSKAITAALSASGRKLARSHKRMKVFVNVTLSGSTTSSSRSLTLRF